MRVRKQDQGKYYWEQKLKIVVRNEIKCSGHKESNGGLFLTCICPQFFWKPNKIVYIVYIMQRNKIIIFSQVFLSRCLIQFIFSALVLFWNLLLELGCKVTANMKKNSFRYKKNIQCDKYKIQEVKGYSRIHITQILLIFSTEAFVVRYVLQHKRENSKYCHHSVQIPVDNLTQSR